MSNTGLKAEGVHGGRRQIFSALASISLSNTSYGSSKCYQNAKAIEWWPRQWNNVHLLPMIILQTLATENWVGLTSADKSRMWNSVGTVLAARENKERALFWWYYGFLFSRDRAQGELPRTRATWPIDIWSWRTLSKKQKQEGHSDLLSPSSLTQVMAPHMRGAPPGQEERSAPAPKIKGCCEEYQQTSLVCNQIATLRSRSSSSLLSNCPLFIPGTLGSQNTGVQSCLRAFISLCHVKLVLNTCVCFSLVN